MLYFAYGSNMLPAQMEERCASATLLYAATLEDYRLAFTRTAKGRWRGYGVADVVASAGDRVWGGIVEIDDKEVAALDRAEGYQPGRTTNAYRRIEVIVSKDGDRSERIAAETYVVCAREEPNPLPHRDYVACIIAGAEAIKLPANYIDRLRGIAVRD